VKVREAAGTEHKELTSKLDSLAAAAKRTEFSGQSFELGEASQLLKDAKNGIAQENINAALEALIDARANIEAREADAYKIAVEKLESQRGAAGGIANESKALAGELEDYAQSISTPNAASVKSVKAELSAQQARTLAKEAEKAGALQISEAKPKDYADGFVKIDVNEKKIESARKTIDDAIKSLEKSIAAFEAGARTKARDANIRAQIALQSGQMKEAESSAMKDDLEKLGMLLDDGQWIEAAELAESIIGQAKRYQPPVNAEPPYLIIAITLLLLIAIVYVVLKRKPPAKKEGDETAHKLQKEEHALGGAGQAGKLQKEEAEGTAAKLEQAV